MKPTPALPTHRAASASHAPTWRWAVAGAVLGLTATLLLQAPAYWLAAVLARASAERVQLSGSSGTLWDGQAQLRLTGGPDSQDASALPGLLHWQLRPTLTGLWLQLRSDCCTEAPLQLQAQWRWGGLVLHLQDGRSQWPAALLAGLGTPWNTLRVQGRLQLQTQALALQWVQGRLSLSGQAELLAQELSSRLSTLQPMGSYRLRLQGGQTSTLQLDTLEGSLQLEGSGSWVGQRLRFEGSASAAPGRVDALANLLNIIGRRNGARSIIKVG